MDFMSDYLRYHSAYEIPINYVRWSAFGLLGAVVNRKVHFLHGDIDIPPYLYILMVGPQGNSKSTPCSFARKMFEIVCPDLEIGADTQSAEDICIVMSKDGFARSYTNENGEPTLVSPYAFFIEEFKDFIAYSPVRMLNFLGNIYSKNPFRSSTVKRGLENIINPSLNVLACENPDQLSKFMKNDVFTGGLSRRFIIVYETDYAEPKPFIDIPDDSEERKAWHRVKQRLIDVRKVTGLYKWADSGRKFYAPWYIEKQRSLATMSNKLMAGYVSTKHVQLFKICMLLDVVSDKPMFLFTDELLQHGLAFLDVIETNMPRLSLAAGRNEMVSSYHLAVETLRSNGGAMSEKELKKVLEMDLPPYEIFQALRYLEETDRIVKKQMAFPNSEGKPIPRTMILTPERWAKGVKDGQFKET